MTYFPTDPWKSSLAEHPDHARMLGMLVASWNALESYWAGVVTVVCNADGHIIHAMLYALESPRARLHAIRAALELLVDDEVELAEIASAMDETEKVLTKRNNLAHARYMAAEDGSLRIVRLKEFHLALEKINRQLPLKELEAAFERSRHLEERVVKLLSDRLRARHEASRAQQFPPDDQTG